VPWLDLREFLDDGIDLLIFIRPSADVGGNRLVSPPTVGAAGCAHRFALTEGLTGPARR
jgi:hypothetical protein